MPWRVEGAGHQLEAAPRPLRGSVFVGPRVLPEQHHHAGEVVLGPGLQGLPADRRRRFAGVRTSAEALRHEGRHLPVRKVALGDPVAHEHQDVRGRAVQGADLRHRRHGVVAGLRVARLLVLPVPEGAAHGQVPVHPGHAHDLLDPAPHTHDALALGGVVGLVVRRQAAVGALPLHQRPVRAPQQHAAVADVPHAEVVPASRLARRRHASKCSCRAAAQAGGEELPVEAQRQGGNCRVVLRRPPRLELLDQALCHVGGALASAVAIEDAEEAPVVPDVDDLGILHRPAPAVHLSDPYPEALPMGTPHHEGCHSLLQRRLPHREPVVVRSKRWEVTFRGPATM
mmetsp:Transcript_79755/g.247354  ORF Transcript_79755/g.247354 Transcript_79755/m.247354 type:complete len:342 (-) Transcript_79755:19-1044(-)